MLGHLGTLRHELARLESMTSAAHGRSRLTDLIELLKVQPVINSAMVLDRLGVLDGGYRIAVEPGAAATCERVSAPEGSPTLTPPGVALWWSGAQRCTTLRRLGHLTGPADGDELLDALTAGASLHVRDYF